MDQITEYIRWHAGFLLSSDAGLSIPECLPITQALYLLRNNQHVDLEPSFQHLLDCMQEINLILNGDQPSQGSAQVRYFDRDLVSAISTILCAVMESALILKSTDLSKLSWKLCFAWQAITAGDIDDLSTALEFDEIARFDNC